jgi:hypothetical protein
MSTPEEIQDLFLEPPAKKVITLESAGKTLSKIVVKSLGLKKKAPEAEAPSSPSISEVFSQLNKDAIARHLVDALSPGASSSIDAANNIGFGIAAAVFRKVGKSEEWIEAYFERMQANQLKNVELVQPIAEKIVPIVGGQLIKALEKYEGVGGELATTLVSALMEKVGPAYDEMRNIIYMGPASSGAQLPANAPHQIK